MSIWEQKNRETWASMRDCDKTTEKLKRLIINHKQSPHVYNTPTDQWFYQFACEDLLISLACGVVFAVLTVAFFL